MPDATVTASDGVVVAVHDLSQGETPVLMAHAAGFHGRALSPLAERLAGAYRCLGLDLRGHGDSPLPPDRAFDWPGMARDVLAAARLAPERPRGLGHSSGATAMLLAEQSRPGTFAALYLFEPVLLQADPATARGRGTALADGARRRRDRFADRDEAYRHYQQRPPLSGLDPAALRAYVDFGFEDTPDGDVRLKCRPEVEAAVYESAMDHDGVARLGQVACPVTVACGEVSPACPPPQAVRLAGMLAAGTTDVVAGVGHFGPMERPDRVAASVRAAWGGRRA